MDIADVDATLLYEWSLCFYSTDAHVNNCYSYGTLMTISKRYLKIFVSLHQSRHGLFAELAHNRLIRWWRSSGMSSLGRKGTE